MSDNKTIIMTANDMENTLKRITHEIIEKIDLDNAVIVGIKRRGEILAKRINNCIEKFHGTKLKEGALDITLYRDDLSMIDYHPIIRGTELNFDINDKIIILVDDVLFTGRTVRSALDELVDFGRPSAIRLVVFIDRGNRELPIKPDFVGKEIQTNKGDMIEVHVKEIDGDDSVILIKEE